MARGNTRAASEAPIPAAYKKLIKASLAATPKQYFPPDEDGEGRTIQADRLIGNLAKGGNQSTGVAFGSVKELIDGLPDTARADAAGLVTDLVELSYLKGIKDVRMEGAKQYGPGDVAAVEARMDAQIEEIEKLVGDGLKAFPRSIGSDIVNLVSQSIKDADDESNRRRGAAINPLSTREVKKMLNEVYETMLANNL